MHYIERFFRRENYWINSDIFLTVTFRYTQVLVSFGNHNLFFFSFKLLQLINQYSCIFCKKRLFNLSKNFEFQFRLKELNSCITENTIAFFRKIKDILQNPHNTMDTRNLTIILACVLIYITAVTLAASISEEGENQVRQQLST